MSYGKHFASCYNGSMVGAGTDVFAVWGYIIAHAVESQVELNPVILAAILGSTVEQMEAAVAKLCEPDPKSRNKECDGRRLVREGAFAYRVVSHTLYRQMRNEDERREYNRLKQREHRSKRSMAVNDTSMKSMTVIEKYALSANTESEAESKAETESESPPTPPSRVLPFPEYPDWESVKMEAAKIGLPEAEARKWFDKLESTGWKYKGDQITNWRAFLVRARTWWQVDQAKPKLVGTNGESRPASTFERKTQLEAVREQITAVRNAGHNDAWGWKPKTQEDREKMRKLKATEKQLVSELAGV